MENGFNLEGFGTVSREQLDGLLKSLQTGGDAYNAAPNTLTQGTAMMVENLDSTLHSVTVSMKNLKFWPMIPKQRAYSTVVQYNRQTGYGESSNGAFFNADAGTAPAEHTASYNRQLQVVKYIGTTRVVAKTLTLVTPAHGPIIAQQIKAGTMYILTNLERKLFEANGFFQSATGTFTGAAGDIPTSSAQFNGLEEQIRIGGSDSTAQYTGFEKYGGVVSPVEDLAGGAPDDESFDNLANRSLENHGSPSHVIIDPKTHRDISKSYLRKERIGAPQMGSPSFGQAGFVLNKFNSVAGELAVVSDVFLRPKDAPLESGETGAPGVPVIGSTTTAADTDAKFSAAVGSDQPEGTYSYRVSAVNNAGESAACASSVQAITAGNRVHVVISAGTSGAVYYAAYRAPVGTIVGHKFIGYVKDSSGSGGGATFRDAGNKTPGGATGYLLEMAEDNLAWYQLCPLMKMDLATVGPAYRWMQMLFGTPIVTTPLHNALLDNIGRSA